ncbi:hypothetical protein LAZ40_17525 [Cereibacter sphaeroides]|uniref:hypothetical protein n=1 Tax=Rhodobacterales TaxID=204455 RepID=UPI000BBEE44C|nr:MULTISPECIES: hypothetical protein [Paracoccaceae]MCE6951504.1 hypothetical protein [Cereibacter sphaeroides]MCE6960829.1 hypothetical protein [Cereibacter sphaeroides]MCE6969905.1 hypothetical protein [Cereibacter sphaeroides]MCE6974293.1 hypothetical protein [Cereibacter sphaeroides]
MKYRITYGYERHGRERVDTRVLAFEITLNTPDIIEYLERRLGAVLRLEALTIFDLRPLQG